MVPLLSTKLFKPRLTDNHVRREMLAGRLSSGFQCGHRLALVCAPAGYGKTTVVLEFLDSINVPSAWISLDEGDNDQGRFLAYLAAALRKIGVKIGNDLDLLVDDTGINATETILNLLINCISDCHDQKILVLDDYHLIRSPKVHGLLRYILDFQPPNLYLIIISREDPPLTLAGLRMKNRLTEIRLGDLIFKPSEAQELFNKIAAMEMNSQAVEKVTSRTEGWIAGLQLACLLLKDCSKEQTEAFLRSFDGSNSYIIDYLVEEVLHHQSEDLRDFLCKTSILERMNARLCDHLTGRTDSTELLQQIKKANLFLIPLDDQREWYRYHHLFADSLKSFLSKDEEKNLYKKAAAWMKANDYSFEAVRYAFSSKDPELALKIVEDTVEETFKYAQLDSLIKWMDQLPEDMIRNSEALSVRKAIALFATCRFSEALHYLKSLDTEFEERATSHNKGLLLYIKALIAGTSGGDAEPFAKKALELLESWDPIARTSTLNTLGRAQYRKDKIEEAAETFRCAYEAGLKIGYQFVTALALMNYSSCLQAIGRGAEALDLCRHFIDSMESRFDKLPPYIGIIYVTMAELYSNDSAPEKAQWYREEGLRLCKIISYDISGTLEMFARSKTKTAADKASGPSPIVVSAVKKEAIQLEYNEKLSEREVEILQLISKGLTNQEIAQVLFISTNTAQWHITHIYSKLGVKSRTQAILKARELNIG